MEKLFFMKGFMEWISDKENFKKVVRGLLFCLTVLAVLMGVIMWIQSWKTIFDFAKADAVIGGILFQLIFLVGLYMLAHIVVIRTGQIKDTGKCRWDKLRILKILAKLTGDIYACINVVLGIAGAIFIWFAGEQAGRVLLNMPFMFIRRFDQGFLGGLVFLLSMVAFGTVMMVLLHISASGIGKFIKISECECGCAEHGKEGKCCEGHEEAGASR
mgnify:CR=1 FL=1